VFENELLSKILEGNSGRNMNTGRSTGWWAWKFALFIRYYRVYLIEEDEAIGTCSTHVEMKNVFKRLVGKLEWKREFGKTFISHLM